MPFKPFGKKPGSTPTAAAKSGDEKKPNPFSDKAPPENAKDDKKLAKGKEKVTTPEIKDKVKIDFEPELTKEDIEYVFEDIEEADRGDFADIIEQTLLEIAELGEDLSAATRLKKKAVMRRSRSRIMRARERILRRRATQGQIQGRSRRTAIDMLKHKFSAGRDPSQLGFSEKNRIERMVHKRKNTVARIARKLIRRKREEDTNRVRGK